MRSSRLQRVLSAPVLLLVFSFFAFMLPDLQGIDQARATLLARSQEAEPDEETLAAISAELGLDDPLPVRYWSYLTGVVQGDFGESNVSRTAVWPQVWRATLVSGTVVGLAIGSSVVIASVLGVVAAANQNRWPDRLITGVSRVLVAIPVHVLTPILVYTVALRLDLVPTSGWGGPEHLVLPVVALALSPIALFSQIVRSEMLDTLEQPYIRTALVKGLRWRRVVWMHAARVSLVGVLTLGSLFIAGLLGGAVIAEVILGVPGLGRLLHTSVITADVPMFQGGLLIAVAVGITIGLLGDGLSALLSPPEREG
ncbi:MAG: ABC transporter permease [Actinomycetota bacterium]